MTLREMQSALTDILNRARVDVPSPERLIALLNKAKNKLMLAMEQLNPEFFATRATFTPAQGDASIDLPADFRRMIGLDRVDGTRETPISVVDTRERALAAAENGTIDMLARAVGDPTVPIGYLEGGKVYFVQPLPNGLTIRMRYNQRVADLTIASETSTYSGIPHEWHDLLVDLAAKDAVPGDNPEWPKLQQSVAEGFGMLPAALARRADNDMPTVRRVW